jgi:hypothetical protein
MQTIGNVWLWGGFGAVVIIALLVALEIWAAQRFGWAGQVAKPPVAVPPVEPSPCSAHRA